VLRWRLFLLTVVISLSAIVDGFPAASKERHEQMSAQERTEMLVRMQERRENHEVIEETRKTREEVIRFKKERAKHREKKNNEARIALSKPPTDFEHYSEAAKKSTDVGGGVPVMLVLLVLIIGGLTWAWKRQDGAQVLPSSGRTSGSWPDRTGKSFVIKHDSDSRSS